MMHGLDQSQALTKAAQELSAAKAELEAVEASDTMDAVELDIAWVAASAAVAEAKAAYTLAYTLYTNPFGVSKTV